MYVCMYAYNNVCMYAYNFVTSLVLVAENDGSINFVSDEINELFL